MIKIAVFASGSGSNAENIARYFSENKDITVSLIVSNKHDAFVHERAKMLHIPSFTFSKEEFREGKCVLELMHAYEIDYIVLAGFLLKIPNLLLSNYPYKIINIHPALLPKYGGKGMYGEKVHKAVIEAQEAESGITIHYVNEKYDEGNIIFQTGCDIPSGADYKKLAETVHNLEYQYFPEVIEKVARKACYGLDEKIRDFEL